MSDRPAGPELTVLYRIPSGSNAVYRCEDAEGGGWVYKPSAGERPLMDFPDGSLAAREIAAHDVSAALGWDLVPKTVLAFGPGGRGMAQRWVEEADRGSRVGDHDPVDVHPADELPEGRAAVLRGEGAQGEDVVVAHSTDARLRRIALFDVVVNNADRKGGHVLVDTAGQTWAIDHGLSFHTEPKLRTVLWGWAGQPLPEPDLAGLHKVLDGLAAHGSLRDTLSDLLTSAEIEALERRVDGLLTGGVFPAPGPGYPLPWPLF
ncbi:SCO1664 family protein [Dietzia alimentaria]|uniref:SCO1664 family protein n=1 Tax=Dietzia alimentaria TaxID=665550 RepID=UPI000299EF6C|nr:SCO1664 family protein [Dietzia alimentaria]